ncbi:MAG: type III-B CRISPR-associated protein Cas10/Cmr2 [Thermogemmata sp.]|nr:type III-B CRISPR-associated protein Cas10/Cmr2 [Thermogemmata sp.]
MSYLLAVTVGPVQDFIAAARRTRDLWLGSYLLSEISRAAAQAIEQAGGKLIFPAASTVSNVANVVVAELTGGTPAEVIDRARQAVNHRWLEFVREAWDEANPVIRKDVWDKQVDDVIEFYAAWVLQTGNYRQDRQRLVRLLAGRKNCRDFRPNRIDYALPKSSLDGQRETVLQEGNRERWPAAIRLGMRLSAGEQLDVVGVVKRVAGGRRAYPSIMRIAADPWVRGNEKKAAFAELVQVCAKLPGEILHRVDNKQFPQFSAFPFEGVVLYRNRHGQWWEETGITSEELQAVHRCLDRLPEPSPYLAVLVADGDRMGAAIARLGDAETNRAFSRTLASFADKAREIVNKHHGVLVYAGGDDVLAFLPADTCLPCARQLHDAFGALMSGYGPKEGTSDGAPTLSVGIAIGHCMENLEDFLEYGRAAEKAAKKPDRDGLAVHLHKRSGAPIRIRLPWSRDPDKSLLRYAELIQRDAIPSKLPYELRKMADVYENWLQPMLQSALQADVLRVIRDKQPRSGRAFLPEIEQIVQQLSSAADLRRFAEELLIARQIANALEQSQGGQRLSVEAAGPVTAGGEK